MVDILLPRPLPGAMGEPSKSKCAQRSGTRGQGGRACAGPCGSSSAPPLPSGGPAARGCADSAGKGCGPTAGAGGCGLGPCQLRCRYSRSCPALPGPSVLAAVRAAELISFDCFHFSLLPSALPLFLSFFGRLTVFLSLFLSCLFVSFFFFYFSFVF